jgi:hypothetical protein
MPACPQLQGLRGDNRLVDFFALYFLATAEKMGQWQSRSSNQGKKRKPQGLLSTSAQSAVTQS